MSTFLYCIFLNSRPKILECNTRSSFFILLSLQFFCNNIFLLFDFIILLYCIRFPNFVTDCVRLCCSMSQELDEQLSISRDFYENIGHPVVSTKFPTSFHRQVCATITIQFNSIDLLYRKSITGWLCTDLAKLKTD